MLFHDIFLKQVPNYNFGPSTINSINFILQLSKWKVLQLLIVRISFLNFQNQVYFIPQL